MTAVCPFRGSGGLAVGAQTGTPLASAQTSVWFGGVPLIAKLEHVGSTMRNAGGGPGEMTSSTKSCVASGGMPLLAVNCSGNVPALPAVPESRPDAALKVMPAGSAPDSARVGAGTPDARIVKLPATPTWNVAVEALVKTGAALVSPNAVRSPPLLAM